MYVILFFDGLTLEEASTGRDKHFEASTLGLFGEQKVPFPKFQASGMGKVAYQGYDMASLYVCPL